MRSFQPSSQNSNRTRTGFDAAIDFMIDDCRGEAGDGKPILRVPPEVHAETLVAAQSGRSLN